MVYAKNVLLFVVLFAFDREPVVSVLVLCFLQLPFSTVCLTLFASNGRQVWVTLAQELFLSYYYFFYSYYQAHSSDELVSSLFVMLYFLGLSISVFGFVFGVVDNKKRVWISREAWPSFQ